MYKIRNSSTLIQFSFCVYIIIMDSIQDPTVSSSSDSSSFELEGDNDSLSSFVRWLEDQSGPADSSTLGDPMHWELEALEIERPPSTWSTETIPNEVSEDESGETDVETEAETD